MFSVNCNGLIWSPPWNEVVPIASIHWHNCIGMLPKHLSIIMILNVLFNFNRLHCLVLTFYIRMTPINYNPTRMVAMAHIPPYWLDSNARHCLWYQTGMVKPQPFAQVYGPLSFLHKVKVELLTPMATINYFVFERFWILNWVRLGWFHGIHN